MLRTLFSLGWFVFLLAGGPLVAEPLKIGVIIPLTGPAASMGESLREIEKLLKSEQISLLFQDDQCDGKNALAAYAKLRNEQIHVYYVACSGSIMALAPVVKKNGDLILTSYAGSSRIRETGNEVIRLNPDAISVADSAYSMIAPGERPVAILYEEQDYASSLADHLSGRLGKEAVSRISYRPNATSYLSEIVRIRSSGAKSVFFIPVAYGSAQVILKLMGQYKLPIPVLGEVNLCDFPFRASDFGMHGKCLSARFSGERYDRFIQEYEEVLGHTPAYPFYDAMAFDLFKFLGEHAGDKATVQELKDLLLKGFDGEFARYDFDRNGERIGIGEYMKVVGY